MTADPRPAPCPVAYLFGDDTQSGQQRTNDIRCSGITDIYRLRSDPQDFARLHVPRNYLKTSIRHDLRRLSVVINLVTDPDQNPRVLAAAEQVVKGFGGVVINPPGKVLRTTRPRVARILQGIDGLLVPVTIALPATRSAATRAIEQSGMTFPAILRRAGTHAGRSALLLNSVDEVLANMEPRASYILTQFLDLQDPDGLYRKVRLFCFGESVVFRHLIASDRWSVHAEARERLMASRPDLCEEEARAFIGGLPALSPHAESVVTAIREALGLDFFGMDLGVRSDGALVLFEANATMNFLPMSTDPSFPHGADIFARGRAAVDAMVESALQKAGLARPS